jgi:hypothetical protein
LILYASLLGSVVSTDRADGPRTWQYLLSGRYLAVVLKPTLERTSKEEIQIRAPTQSSASSPSLPIFIIRTCRIHHPCQHLTIPKTQTRASEISHQVSLVALIREKAELLVLHCAYSSCTESSSFGHAAPVIAARPLTSVKASTQRRPDLPFGRACFETRSRAKAG